MALESPLALLLSTPGATAAAPAAPGTASGATGFMALLTRMNTPAQPATLEAPVATGESAAVMLARPMPFRDQPLPAGQVSQGVIELARRSSSALPDAMTAMIGLSGAQALPMPALQPAMPKLREANATAGLEPPIEISLEFTDIDLESITAVRIVEATPVEVGDGASNEVVPEGFTPIMPDGTAPIPITLPIVQPMPSGGASDIPAATLEPSIERPLEIDVAMKAAESPGASHDWMSEAIAASTLLDDATASTPPGHTSAQLVFSPAIEPAGVQTATSASTAIVDLTAALGASSATSQPSSGTTQPALAPSQGNVPTRELQASLGTPAWTEELSTQLTWMTRQGEEAASLRISPEHLGPIEVRIAIKEGEASVWFGATHAETRSSLEQALPRLRELFAEQGLSLADSGVFREAPRQQGQTQRLQSASPIAGALEETPDAAPRAFERVGLVDTYA